MSTGRVSTGGECQRVESRSSLDWLGHGRRVVGEIIRRRRRVAATRDVVGYGESGERCGYVVLVRPV